jgi:hypothetical protein
MGGEFQNSSVPIGMVLAIASSVEYVTEVDDEAPEPTVAEWMSGLKLDHLTTDEQEKVRACCASILSCSMAPIWGQ